MNTILDIIKFFGVTTILIYLIPVVVLMAAAGIIKSRIAMRYVLFVFVVCYFSVFLGWLKTDSILDLIKFFGVPTIFFSFIPIVALMAAADIIKSKIVINYILFIAATYFIFIFLAWLGSTVHWEEEVLLSDGRVLTVSKENISNKGSQKSYRIHFKNPDDPGEEIKWHSVKTSSHKSYSRPERPLILDKEAGVFVIFSTFDGIENCYFKYRYQNHTWVEEASPVSTERFPDRKTNLLISDYKEMSKHITLAVKNAQNFNATRKNYSRVESKRQNCFELMMNF